MTHKIAWMPGDGIGVDVMDATRMVLDALEFDAEYVHGDIGWEYWCSEGDPLPQRTLDILKSTDAALFGAITSKPADEALAELSPELQDKGLSYRSPIVRLRQECDLGVNFRPCRALPGNPLNYRDGIDLVVFRENTEGLYCGVEFFPVPESVRSALSDANPRFARFADVPEQEMAMSCRLITKAGATRIVRAAFEYAQKHGYPTVTLVEKPNVLRETSGLMVRTAREVAADYAGIEMWETNIDAQCMWLVKNPEDYGVLVASNLFGDVLSDLAAQLVGGLGFAAAGNVGSDYAVFEPTHGSAPKYAGKGIANPCAMMLTAQLMLEWLGEADKATRLMEAIRSVVRDGEVRTRDMSGDATTEQMAAAVAARLDG